MHGREQPRGGECLRRSIDAPLSRVQIEVRKQILPEASHRRGGEPIAPLATGVNAGGETPERDVHLRRRAPIDEPACPRRGFDEGHRHESELALMQTTLEFDSVAILAKV